MRHFIIIIYKMMSNFTLFYWQFIASFEQYGEQNRSKMMGLGMFNTLLNNSYFGQFILGLNVPKDNILSLNIPSDVCAIKQFLL